MKRPAFTLLLSLLVSGATAMNATADSAGVIRGSWTNSTRTYSWNSYGPFNGIQIVPEPATLMLLTLGGVLMRKRKLR